MTPRCFLSRFFRLGFIGVALAVAVHAAPLRVLFFTKSSGYEHGVIKWPTAGGMSHAEKVLTALSETHDFVFTFSKDGSAFSADYLADFDIVFFYTSGNLEMTGTDKNPPMSAAGKAALLEWVAQGGSFMATHAGSDCFHTYERFDGNTPKDQRGFRYQLNGEASDPYIKMLGGEFINHGPQQVATARVIDPDFPGYESVGETLRVQEEWYTLKEFAADIHVLLVMETAGMEGKDYQRPDYPLAWARNHGEGRVWFTAMGHREDVWTSDYFQKMLVGGIEWLGHRKEAELTENLLVVTPGAHTIQPE